MVKIAVWCRHQHDNIIGIGPHIPWHISSDFKRFKRLTVGKSLIVGEKTYESFPNHTLPDRKIYILSFNPDYAVSDAANHFVITQPETLTPVSDELYIAGGASVYRFFMQQMPPEIVVDSVYTGDLNPTLTGTPVDITPCIDCLNDSYDQVTTPHICDGIETRVFIRHNTVIDGTVLAHILTQIYTPLKG